METTEYVEGLTGEEIINDILDQVEAKLRADCNLRETDSYQAGYDGNVHVHLNLHGVDIVEIKQDIAVNRPANQDLSGAQITEKTVDAEIVIALEPRLNLVRERSGQEVPTLSKDESGHEVIKKRRYARKNAADSLE